MVVTKDNVGERIAGSDEVRGSIPLGSTISMNVAVHRGCFFSFVAQNAPRILLSSGILGAFFIIPQKPVATPLG